MKPTSPLSVDAATDRLLRPVVRDAAESPIRAMMQLAGEPGVISLAGGHPDPALLPRDWFVESAQRVLARLQTRDLQYGATDGVPALRESICALLSERRISAQPGDVAITTGSQQSISLLASAFLEAGDTVAMAPFNYPAAIQAARFAGASVATLSEDIEGLRGLVGDTPAGRVKAVYVVPSFANPTGHVMSVESRLQLLQEAAEHGILIIEDDPYGELWFDRPPPDSLYALNQSGAIGALVAYATSFSKILLPAFRLGALIAPPAIRRAVLLAKQAADVHSSSLDQHFLDEMLRSGKLAEHLKVLRAAYHRKAYAMFEALQERAADVLSFKMPAGGMFVWAELAGCAVDLDIDWFAFGRAHRVLAVPGSAFSPSGRCYRFVRLSFANPSIEQVREGVKGLAAGLLAESARDR